MTKTEEVLAMFVQVCPGERSWRLRRSGEAAGDSLAAVLAVVQLEFLEV